MINHCVVAGTYVSINDPGNCMLKKFDWFTTHVKATEKFLKNVHIYSREFY